MQQKPQRFWTRRPSSAALWPPIARFIAVEERIGSGFEQRGPVIAGCYEFFRFGMKQGWACLFGGSMVALLVGTHFYYPSFMPLSRYDFLVVAAVAIQIVLLALRMETPDEAKVILLFHVVGTAMELFKTATGSWIYPEASILRLGNVPLFTGFMYGSIGSYFSRVWRLFDFRFHRHPPIWATSALSAGIYLNFFADHYGIDLRYELLAAAVLIFGRTTVFFKVWRVHRRMPLVVGFGLVALFIWFAENLGTYAGAWLYPGQLDHWSMVPPGKLMSWFLLMAISYVMVTWINGPRSIDAREPASLLSASG